MYVRSCSCNLFTPGKDIDANLPVSTKVDLKYSDCPCDGTEIDQYSFENCSVINQVKEYVNFHTIDM